MVLNTGLGAGWLPPGCRFKEGGISPHQPPATSQGEHQQGGFSLSGALRRRWAGDRRARQSATPGALARAEQLASANLGDVPSECWTAGWPWSPGSRRWRGAEFLIPIRRADAAQPLHPMLQQPPPAGHLVALHQLLAASRHRNARSPTTFPLASSLWSCLIWLGAGLIGSGSS